MRAALDPKVSSKSWKLLLLFRFTFCSPNVFRLLSINRLTQESEIFYRRGKLNINSPVCNEEEQKHREGETVYFKAASHYDCEYCWKGKFLKTSSTFLEATMKQKEQLGFLSRVHSSEILQS